MAINGIAGTVYNATPLGNEPGRLAVVTPAGFTTLVSSIPFEITSRGGGDYGLTGTLDDINRLTTVPGISGTCGDSNAVIKGLSFLLNGSTNAYVRNPTSCVVNESTGYAVGYDDPTQVEGPAYYFKPTDCGAVPFQPSLSVSMGSTGTTGTQKYPPVEVKISNGNGHADIKGNVIFLPIELNSNNKNYKLCTQAQADADACPAESQFGTTTATSPFLHSSLSGPVYLIQQSSGSLPGLLLDLKGVVHVKIQTNSFLGANNQQIVSAVTNAPQLPVSELTVKLNGGEKTGVFQNRSDLCFEDDSTTKFKSYSDVVAFDGWNGAYRGSSYSTTVKGCGPGVGAKLTKAQTSKPQLKVSTDKHPGAEKIKEIEVSLPKGLTLVKKYFKRVTGNASANLTRGQMKYVNKRKFRVTGLPAAGVNKINLTAKNKAIKLSKSKRKSLNKGKKLNFKIKVTDTPVSGDKVSTTGTASVKGKKK